MLPGRSKNNAQVSVNSTDRLFLKVMPFDSTVEAELSRLELDPGEIYDNLASELHYQIFLRKQEESPDSAGATVRVSISFSHLQPGAGNSGTFVSAEISAERDKGMEKASLELRRTSKDNVPADYLVLHLPRMLTQEILERMKRKKVKAANEGEFTPPLMLLF